ncbi:BRO1-like domain-containing protein [Zychaea mexicana]|uniref:BRO1-like domain-containing protein n=1 Tax=Zychaea mexicana TaxID=64656 RepID=UPI0022FDE9E2|nr:BRO1-like domain-containing protein [Zychaea mexicana]KAI9491620.1 BRO1-like domain-containing protein [Zychaea mexicana]
MSQSQIPFLSVPFKRTTDVDWTFPLKSYIAHVYQEDPEKYSEEAYTLNRLRQDTRGAGKDLTGRDLLYRYFGQLELLDLRFPVDERNVKVLFNWYDAFDGRAIAQYSLAYEKASILFNIGATLSSIAAAQNRAEADGRKKTFNYFQAAAGVFQYINDNFLHAPSQDLSRETVKMLSELMLAQAHECFLESSIREKKRDGLVAKLASHAVWVYGNLIDAMQDAVGRGVGIEKAWITLCQVKHKYYQALTQQHKAAFCESEKQFGEQVARLQVSESAAKEASGKLATNLIHQIQSSNHANGTISADGGSVLQELAKSLAATSKEKCTSATRDNDMIYHDNVPQESILTPSDRLKAVKPIPMSELYGQNDIGKVIGPDIFASLVPLSVHESASLYSEEKAKLLRTESERCELAEAELKTSLEYMNLPASLEKFRKQEDQSLDELMTPSKEVRQWAEDIAIEESADRTSIREIIQTLEGFKRHATQKLDEATLSLDQEMHECEKMRVKYGELWTQQPSSQIAGDFRRDIKNHRQTLEQANISDSEIVQRLDKVSKDIDILKKGSKSSDLERAFTETASAVLDQGSQNADTQSLLDLDMTPDNGSGNSNSNMKSKLNSVESALEKLRNIESERKETFQDLRQRSMDDDISNVLILNKKTSNVEQQIFTAELEKYNPHQQRISATIQQQKQAIRELADAFKALVEDKDAEKLQKRYGQVDQRRQTVITRFNNARTQYFEVREDLNKGIQFYSNASDVIDSLCQNVKRFVQERDQERKQLAEKLDTERSVREQEMLKQKIESYNPSAPSMQPVDSTDGMANLTNQARFMSLNSSTGSTTTSNAPPTFATAYSPYGQPSSITGSQQYPQPPLGMPLQQQQQQQQQPSMPPPPTPYQQQPQPYSTPSPYVSHQQQQPPMLPPKPPQQHHHVPSAPMSYSQPQQQYPYAAPNPTPEQLQQQQPYRPPNPNESYYRSAPQQPYAYQASGSATATAPPAPLNQSPCGQPQPPPLQQSFQPQPPGGQQPYYATGQQQHHHHQQQQHQQQPPLPNPYWQQQNSGGSLLD